MSEFTLSELLADTAALERIAARLNWFPPRVVTAADVRAALQDSGDSQ